MERPDASAQGGPHPAVVERLAACLARAPTPSHRRQLAALFERTWVARSHDGGLSALIETLRTDELWRCAAPAVAGHGKLDAAVYPRGMVVHGCVSLVDAFLRAMASADFEGAYFAPDERGQTFRACHDRAVLRALGCDPVDRRELSLQVDAWTRAAVEAGLDPAAKQRLLCWLFEDVAEPLDAARAAQLARVGAHLEPGMLELTNDLRARLAKLPALAVTCAWFRALAKTLGFGRYQRREGSYEACAAALESGRPVVAYCQDAPGRAEHVVGLVAQHDSVLIVDSQAAGALRTTSARLRRGELEQGSPELRGKITGLLVPSPC